MPIMAMPGPAGPGVQLRAWRRQSTLVTASTGIGAVVTAAPLAPRIVAAVRTQVPRMMRPELE